jgi:3-hydroxybutyryl-CoA dehydrogenase
VVQRCAQACDVGLRSAHVRRSIERALGLPGSSERGQRPSASQFAGCIKRSAREDHVVGVERPLGVPAGYRDRGETEPIGNVTGMGRRSVAVGGIGAVEVSKAQTRETEHMPNFGVAGPPTNGLLETRQRLRRLAPAGAAHPSLARAVRRGRRDLRGLVIGLERVVVAVGELEGMAELDERSWVAFRQAPLELLDFRARGHEIAARAEHTNEQAPGGEVARMRAQVATQRCDGLGVAILAHQALCPLGHARGCARDAERDPRPKRGMSRAEHARRMRMAHVDEIKRIGVLGAGQMGSGIAQLAGQCGFDVALADVSRPVAERAKARIADILLRQVAKAKMDAGAREATLGRIDCANDAEGLSNCDLVIEAAIENLEVKAALLRRCDAVLPAGKWLASNTSSISLTKLASATGRPDRVIGMHFMNPPPLMALVEIVRAEQTSEETYAVIKALAERLGKTVITSRDAPGFVVNRVLIPMLCEACFALQEGVASPEDIDTGAKLGLNHPMGPLELADLIGLDTVLAIADVMHREMGDDKYRAPVVLRNAVAAGWLGRKVGRGFYFYDERGRRIERPS